MKSAIVYHFVLNVLQAGELAVQRGKIDEKNDRKNRTKKDENWMRMKLAR